MQKQKSNVIDISGKTYGKLTTIRPISRSPIKYLCQCSCGNFCTPRKDCLISGNSTSCGCSQREAVTKHGYEGTAIYLAWVNMRKRCSDTKWSGYKYYGGRGITVSTEWQNFQNFLKDMEATHVEGLQLDRIDTNGNYGSENCRWVTPKENARNRRNGNYIEHNGETKSLAEWMDITGITRSTIRMRIKNGWSIEKALTTPPQRPNPWCRIGTSAWQASYYRPSIKWLQQQEKD